MKVGKKISVYILMLSFCGSLIFSSCSKDDDILTLVLQPLHFQDITQTTLVCSGDVYLIGDLEILARGVCWSTEPNPTLTDKKTIDGSGAGVFSSKVSGLNPRTKYFIRAYATTRDGTNYGKNISFVTQAGQVPESKTKSIGNITRNSATCSGEVTSDGGLEVTLRGFCYSTSPNPTLSGNYISNGKGSGNYITDVTGLAQGATYFIRAFASNSAGTTYGNEIVFTTNVIPNISTTPAFFIKGNLAKAGGIVNDNGGAAKLTSGLCWSTNPGPTLENHFNTSLAYEMTGLIPNTVYYVRAYATNSSGTAYGNEISFNSGYEIGSSIGGGIVFYNDGHSHGLIAAPYDQSIAEVWGCDGSVIGAFANDIKTGSENTGRIVEGCSSESFAAKLCYDLTLKKYSDWYLPSSDELILLYQNLYRHKLGNFAGNYYWSSSEYGDIQAWLLDFSGGRLYYSSKSSFLSVRAIRTF